MSCLSAKLPPSPVSAAFHGIQWDPLDKLRLSKEEKLLLRSAEANPIDYTLADRRDAAAYTKILLKVLGESSGPSGPSSKVSHLKHQLPDAEALQMLYVDAMGVVTHYAITKLYEVVVCLREKKNSASVTVATTFYNEEGGMLIDEWRALLRVLHLGGSGDSFTQRGAALTLAYVLIAGCPSQGMSGSSRKADFSSVEEPLSALIAWITSQLQSSATSSLSLVTPTLTPLMSCTEARIIFASSGGIGYLSRHLRSQNVPASSRNKKSKVTGASAQQIYELCFCLWTLTYECDNAAGVRSAFARDGAVKSLVELIASAPREKVVRVSLSALRNLAVCTSDASPDVEGRKVISGAVFLNEMIGCGLMKQVDFMKERQWTDPDIVDDLDILHKLLHENYKEMSRWDVYFAEVESGHLEWGILHTEKFFKLNARKLEGPDGDFSTLKMLIKLTASPDEDVMAIACYDIGEFVRYYPNGRAVAKRLGAKDIVMHLIEHENADVQRHALQCVSKMMVQNWTAVR